MTMVQSSEELIPTRWWQEQPELTNLAPHLARKLIAAGYRTADDIRNAGHEKIRDVDGIGKVGFEEICEWLRSLD